MLVNKARDLKIIVGILFLFVRTASRAIVVKGIEVDQTGTR
jgi:hypothetical protein